MVRVGHLCCLILFFSVVSLYGEVSLLSFAEEIRADLQWEPFRKVGSLVKGDSRVLFRPGAPYILIDFREVTEIDPIFVREGQIMLPDVTAALLRDLLRGPEPGGGARIAVVVIDPGHGGKDPGTNHFHVYDGEKLWFIEKNIVLQVATDLHALLKSRYPGKKVVLTRDTDIYLELEERVDIVNSMTLEENEAIIFVSIHANASLNPSTYGYEVWYLPPEYGRKNLINESELTGDSENVRSILNMMMDEEFTIESILLGREILNGLEGTVGEGTINRGLKEETWFVVRNAKMPSVLVELGFVTNAVEARRMGDRAHLRNMAKGIYNGIATFIDDFEQSGGFTQ